MTSCAAAALLMHSTVGNRITDFNAAQDKFDVSGLQLLPGNQYCFITKGGVDTSRTLMLYDSSGFKFILTGRHSFTDEHFIGLVSV